MSERRRKRWMLYIGLSVLKIESNTGKDESIKTILKSCSSCL